MTKVQWLIRYRLPRRLVACLFIYLFFILEKKCKATHTLSAMSRLLIRRSKSLPWRKLLVVTLNCEFIKFSVNSQCLHWKTEQVELGSNKECDQSHLECSAGGFIWRSPEVQLRKVERLGSVIGNIEEWCSKRCMLFSAGNCVCSCSKLARISKQKT